MDKLEYIPGDLVSVYVGVKKYIVEVIGTENENEALLYQIKFPNGEIQYADKDNIVPIPITPEILEKNGWSREDGVFGVSPDFKKIIDDPARKKGYITCMSVYPFFDNDGFSFFYVNQKLAIIHYIHELQHIFYGLKINSEMEV